MFGEKDDLRVSFQFSVPSQSSSKSGSSGSQTNSPDTVIDSIESPSIESAINLADRICK